jgi:hypothetical protein
MEYLKSIKKKISPPPPKKKEKLPSNRKFGIFFSSIFFLVGTYFLYANISKVTWVFYTVALFFLVITLFKPKLLLPLNKLWMSFGLFLGMIINPIVMGIIFFGLITPYAIFMRTTGRDELRLKNNLYKSHWVIRQQSSSQTNFKQQF